MISADQPHADQAGRGGDRPADPGDRCPHPRPFPVDFSACPAHQAVSFVATDALDRPLATSLTCRHLTTGEAVRSTGQFYARCGLGGEDDRLRWLATVTPARLEVMRALQEEFDVAMAGHSAALFEARALLLQRPTAPERRELLERRLHEFLDGVSVFLAGREARFEDVGLPVEPLARVVEDMSWAWARTRSYAGAEQQRRRLAAFAPASQAFLRPVAEAPWRVLHSFDGVNGTGPAGEVLLDTGAVRVARLEGRQGVSVSGEIDAANAESVSAALDAGLGGAGDRHLDLSGLLFSAVAGLRAVVQAAQCVEPGGRLVVHGMPAHLQRAMHVAGWADQRPLVFAAHGARLS
jgi:anti-anti-sigma factor